MKAIILSAGYATRLYPLTQTKPKALLTIKNKPIIEFILKKVEKIKDIKEIIIVTNNKFYPLFKKFKENYNSKKNIKIINDLTESEETRLGAIGDLRFVIHREKIDHDIIVIAGDNLFDFDLEDFVKYSQKVSSLTIGVYDIKNIEKARKFGVVKVNSKNCVTKFLEKPYLPFSTLIGTGLYFIPSHCLNFIEEYLNFKNNRDALGHFIEWLMKKKIKVFGYKFKGTWFDIGDQETYEEAKRYFEKG